MDSKTNISEAPGELPSAEPPVETDGSLPPSRRRRLAPAALWIGKALSPTSKYVVISLAHSESQVPATAA